MEYSLLERDSSINKMDKAVLDFASTLNRANIFLLRQMMALRWIVCAANVCEMLMCVVYMEYTLSWYNYIWICKNKGLTTIFF